MLPSGRMSFAWPLMELSRDMPADKAFAPLGGVYWGLFHPISTKVDEYPIDTWNTLLQVGTVAHSFCASQPCPTKPDTILHLSRSLRGSADGDDRQTVFADTGDARRGLLMQVVVVVCYVVWSNVGFVPMAVLIGPVVYGYPIYLDLCHGACCHRRHLRRFHSAPWRSIYLGNADVRRSRRSHPVADATHAIDRRPFWYLYRRAS